MVKTRDGKMVKVKSPYITKKEQLIIKIREDLIELFDDMDILEKQEIRLDYLDLGRGGWNRRKEELWQYVLDKDYLGQVEFLSEMFIEYLDKKEFEEWIYNINTREKFDEFFKMFKSSDINDVKSVHAVVLKTVMDYKERKVC